MEHIKAIENQTPMYFCQGFRSLEVCRERCDSYGNFGYLKKYKLRSICKKNTLSSYCNPGSPPLLNLCHPLPPNACCCKVILAKPMSVHYFALNLIGFKAVSGTRLSVYLSEICLTYLGILLLSTIKPS